MSSQKLPLNEYSMKYNVSLSTLRRRIRAGDIEYSFLNGKYLIPDSPMSSQPQKVIASAPLEEDQTREFNSQEFENLEPLPLEPTKKMDQTLKLSVEKEINSERSLLPMFEELKKAYTKILQEKEEQIIHLKEEINDLKTLVRVFEHENERLKRVVQGKFHLPYENEES